MTYCTA